MPPYHHFDQNSRFEFPKSGIYKVIGFQLAPKPKHLQKKESDLEVPVRFWAKAEEMN